MLENNYAVESKHINRAGHVDNVEIYRWFNEERLLMFLNFAEQCGHVFVPPYVKTELQFKREIFDHAPIHLKSYVSHIGNKSFSVIQTLEQDGELCAECETVAVNFCPDEQVAILINDEVRAALSRLSKP